MPRAAAIVLALAAALARGTPPPPPAFDFPQPSPVVPLKHSVELTIDPGREVFEGTARIEVDIQKPVPAIWLNAKNLTPDPRASLTQGKISAPVRVWVANGEFLGVETGGRQGRWTVSIHYRGHLDDRGVLGPFRRKVDGEWYVYTTFTPIEARRAFPCFDEPRFKTPWDIAIRVPAGNEAFSNGAETGETAEPDGSKLIRFAETRPLPAEVVAFAVGPFSIYDGGTVKGTPVRVLTPRGRAKEGQAAAEATAAVLPALEDFTGSPYAFGKLDELAMPASAFGAVENPGLIVYYAREFLIPPGTETPAMARALRALESHELAHQWFGDLVTQQDWADTWLSEGFATWLSAHIMDRLGPPGREHVALIVSRERIMRVDSSRHSRPVRVPVENRKESQDIYNQIVYYKGASVLMMLEGWLGEDSLRSALRSYLNFYRFKSASTWNLARVLSGIGVDRDLGIADVLHSFLDRTGVPRVAAQIKCGSRNQLILRQTGATAIPICFRIPRFGTSCAMLRAPSAEVTLPVCPAWIYLNAGGTGYYRTTWTDEQLNALALDQLNPAERLTLAYDLGSSHVDPAARQILTKLAMDAEPEIASAARDALRPSLGRKTPRQTASAAAPSTTTGN